MGNKPDSTGPGTLLEDLVGKAWRLAELVWKLAEDIEAEDGVKSS